MHKENEVRDLAQKILTEKLSLIPGGTTIQFLDPPEESTLDILLKVTGNWGSQIIVAEVKTLGTPKSIRAAVNQLLVYRNLGKVEDRYCMVVAPFISHESTMICKEAGIGYMDLSGNCWVTFQNVFLHYENMENRFPFKTGLTSLYTSISERILRILLTEPYRIWRNKDLAREADVSTSMVTQIKKVLIEKEWIISDTAGGLTLTRPEELLQEWLGKYSFEKNQLTGYYAIRPVDEIENEISRICEERDVQYAFTGFSASTRWAPMVRGTRSMVYISENMDVVAELADLKPVNSGANVQLITPYDDGVFWNSQIINSGKVVTPIQAYLDLKHLAGRGEEAAEFLYKEVIEERWLQQKQNMIRP